MLIKKQGEKVREATAEEEAQIRAEEEKTKLDNNLIASSLEMLVDLDFRLMMIEEFGGEI